MSELQKGQKVKVVKDNIDPKSGWVGAIVEVVHADGTNVTVKVIAGEEYPDNTEWFTNGDEAYFMRDEVAEV
jgi:hypothetical protein